MGVYAIIYKIHTYIHTCIYNIIHMYVKYICMYTRNMLLYRYINICGPLVIIRRAIYILRGQGMHLALSTITSHYYLASTIYFIYIHGVFGFPDFTREFSHCHWPLLSNQWSGQSDEKRF